MATSQQYIGYDNIVNINNISADSETAGFPVTNAANPATNLKWKSGSLSAQYVTVITGGAVDVDYFGVAGHNLGSSRSEISVELKNRETEDYYPAGITWTQMDDRPILKRIPKNIAPATPEDDGFIIDDIVSTFDAGSVGDPVISLDDLGGIVVGYYAIRLKITPVNNTPQVAVIYVGRLMQMQRNIYVGHTPIRYGRDVLEVNGMSESGAFLGRIIRQTSYSSDIKMKNITPSWYREVFEPFVAACIARPFFYAWRLNDYADEIGYCWFYKGAPIPDNTGPQGMMSVSFKVGGVA